MGTEERDPVTGETTTGHEWNGIEELNTPVPRVVLFFLAATILFSIIYWVLMPAWPTGRDYTKGVLGADDRAAVTRQVEEAAAARAVWGGQIAALPADEIAANETLMRHVRETGQTMFIDNCAVCHGVNGKGGPGFPDLTAGSWLWGGDQEALAETIRVGINSAHDDSRISQMMGFGRAGVLDREQVLSVSAYVRSLAGQTLSKADEARVDAGKDVFAANCASCHGDDGKGKYAFGAPDLTDGQWLYGGDAQSIFDTIHGGRQGHMPHWEGRLSPDDIKLLSIYIGQLGRKSP